MGFQPSPSASIVINKKTTVSSILIRVFAKYSLTSVTRTLMARLLLLIQTLI